MQDLISYLASFSTLLVAALYIKLLLTSLCIALLLAHVRVKSESSLFISQTRKACKPLLACYLVEQLQPIFFGGGQHTAPYRAIRVLFIQNFCHAITSPRPPIQPFLIPQHFFPCFVITRISPLHIRTGMMMYI